MSQVPCLHEHLTNAARVKYPAALLRINDEKNYSRDTGNMTDSPCGGGMDVFLGEYAAQANNWRAALAEAAYMTGLERNGDIVVMSAYAPLFGNLTAAHWAPDLIWFNNHQVTCSVNYYVQKVFSLNAGTALLSSELEGAELTLSTTLQGKVGAASWNTAVKFDNVKIVDNETGEVLAEEDFSLGSLDQWERVSDGNWSIVDGELVQSSSTTDTNRYSTTGSAVYFGDESWNNYTYFPHIIPCRMTQVLHHLFAFSPKITPTGTYNVPEVTGSSVTSGIPTPHSRFDIACGEMCGISAKTACGHHLLLRISVIMLQESTLLLAERF